MTALLKASALRVSFADRARKPLFGPVPELEVLHGVDFEIAPGECVGIVGESGSGKTTLGRALLGLVRPASGEIVFESRSIANLPERDLRPLRARLQMVFQNPLSAFNPRRTVGESIAAPVAATGLAHGGAARALARTALERAGLASALFDRYPHELSGGQRQRAGIARAIVTSPKFILADEILSGLDASTQAQILTLLRELQKELGLALAFIAHDLSVVRVLCSRVMVMLAGKVVEQGPTMSLFNWPRHAYTRQLLDAIPLPVVDREWLDRLPPSIHETTAEPAPYDPPIAHRRNPLMGEFIKVKARDGGKFRAYLATPEKGSGPGLVLVQEIFGINAFMTDMADRFAEEGYVVLVPDIFWRLEPAVSLGYSDADVAKARGLLGRLDMDQAVEDIGAAVRALRKRDEHKGKIGVLGYCLGGSLAYLAAAREDVDCAVSYYGSAVDAHLGEAKNASCPMVFHLAGDDAHFPQAAQERLRHAFRKRKDVAVHVYPGAKHAFANHHRDTYDKPAAMMAYSRSLALLRGAMGPVYDLGHLWDMHCYHEFATRDVDATMQTMVPEPYVNHIPTMTGGVGHDHLKRFYKYHFVDSNPDDTKLIPISRTIGSDRVVDEMLFCFTHTREIDWMLPGIKPTGKYVEVPLVAIICFRGDRLYNEHIYWDQASVLHQIGVLNAKGLPVAGIETARKLLDETRPSNDLMADQWKKSEGKPV